MDSPFVANAPPHLKVVRTAQIYPASGQMTRALMSFARGDLTKPRFLSHLYAYQVFSATV